MTPSVQAARMTYAAAPEALQGAVSGGFLGCGSVVPGSAEVVSDSRATGITRLSAGERRDAVARDMAAAMRAAKRHLPMNVNGAIPPVARDIDFPRCGIAYDGGWRQPVVSTGTTSRQHRGNIGSTWFPRESGGDGHSFVIMWPLHGHL